jgi:hypothetical protein
VSEPEVHLVRRCDRQTRVIRSAWWNKTEAKAEAERLAREHAAKTKARCPSRRARVECENDRWLVQKFVDRYNGEWHTLSHYEVMSVAVQGSVVDRLAELVR